MKHVWLALAATVVLSSCAPRTKLNVGNRIISSTEIHSAIRANRDSIHSLRCQGNISIESPVIAQSGSFKLMVVLPDTIAIEIQGPFGLRVGSGVITRRDFVFYNALENLVLTGSTSPHAMRQVLQVPLSFDDILTALTGGGFASTDEGSPDDARPDDGQFLLEYRDRMTARSYWIDPMTLLLRRQVVVDQSGKLMLERTFGNYQSVGSSLMPMNIRFLHPRERSLVVLTFSEVERDADISIAPVRIPSNAERVVVQ
ncbi:MAG: DUF4292 domain-containing protein [Ignavibacteriales bacterium]|nr:DUF4292 domain-containing protein [Ignavibacteriales bacterium]